MSSQPALHVSLSHILSMHVVAAFLLCSACSADAPGAPPSDTAAAGPESRFVGTFAKLRSSRYTDGDTTISLRQYEPGDASTYVEGAVQFLSIATTSNPDPGPEDANYTEGFEDGTVDTYSRSFSFAGHCILDTDRPTETNSFLYSFGFVTDSSEDQITIQHYDFNYEGGPVAWRQRCATSDGHPVDTLDCAGAEFWDDPNSHSTFERVDWTDMPPCSAIHEAVGADLRDD